MSRKGQSTMTKILQFGEIAAGEEYVDRPGSYAIIKKDEKILLVKIIGWGKYFLPGGGIDEGEDGIEALHREAGEETGFLIDIVEKVGNANQYVYSPGVGMFINKVSEYYTARIIGENPALKTEDDHQPEWHYQEEAIKLLYLKSDQWALREAIQK